MPRVAVNIVTWNSAAYIRHNLAALAQQTHRDFGVTVVDNHSADATTAMVEEAFEGFAITLIKNPANEGYSAAHNRAIRATDSAFVLALNPDVLLAPGFIQNIVHAAETDARIGSAGGKLLRIAKEDFPDAVPDGEPARSYPIDEAGILLYKNRRQFPRGYLQDSAQHCLASEYIFGPGGAAALYRRTMLDDVQVEGEYFDEIFFAHKEDIDLAWRAQLLGWRSIYSPTALAYHVRGFQPGQRKQMSPKIRRDAVKNRWLMGIKNELPALFLRDLPHILVYEAKILGYLVLFEQASLLALWDTLRLLRRMTARRAAIQQRRKSTVLEMAKWFI